MKRKFVAAVLVLALIMGMNTIAMAKETSEGEAGIAYLEGEIIVVDPKDPDKPDKPFEPDDPDVPNKETWSFMTSRNIDFGKHDLTQNIKEQKYASWLEARGVDKDYVGVVIKNGTTDPLTVTVEIDKFVVIDDNAKPETLKGFILDLVKDDFIARVTDEGENKANITNPNDIKNITNPVKATADSTNPTFNKAKAHHNGQLTVGVKATILDTPGIGVHAATWGGVLTVPQNTVAKVGEAQAIMTWSFERVVPPVTPDP